MIIVNCIGGLGNQLFQYAFYNALRKQSEQDVKLYLGDFQGYNLHNGFELDRVFNIFNRENIEVATREERNALPQFSIHNRIYRRVMQKIWPEKLKEKFFYLYCLDGVNSICYDERLLHLQNVFLNGYYQSEKYFLPVAEEIRQVLVFPELPIDDKYGSQIIVAGNRAVSLHVRRGDYLQYGTLADVCNLAYYRRAIRYINERVENAKFFVFSNDVAWCRENLPLKEAVFVEGNVKTNSYRDMQLMSMCAHNIIANSSFSWWGAWLNVHKGKIVIAPQKWRNDENGQQTDIISDSWIKIDNSEERVSIG